MDKSIERPPVLSEGDLEVITIYENHCALARIVSPFLYEIRGSPTHQEIWFHSEETYSLFLLRVVELFSEGRPAAEINGKNENFSLFEAAERLTKRHTKECKEVGLTSACAALRTWLDNKPEITFWCPEIEKQITFRMPNIDLIRFGANAEKHSIVRLQCVLKGLGKLCESVGVMLEPQQKISVLEAFREESNNRLHYHSSHLVELLGRYFLGFNRLIQKRYEANPTNHCRYMKHPEGVTSSVFKDMYGAVLVFQNYPEIRITDYTPHTTEFLKMRYR